MNDEERLEDILAVIDDIAEESMTIPVIVEGKKDVRTLRRLGVAGKIEIFNTGKSIYERSEQIAKKTKDVIVLTDWDQKGGMLARRLKEAFISLGTKPDMDKRAKLARLCRGDIKDIESLGKLVTLLRRRIRKERKTDAGIRNLYMLKDD